MKAPDFTYHVPATIEEALSMLSELPNARFLAGGQTLMPMINMRVALPEHLIDLNRLSNLAGIKEVDGRVWIGAMTRQVTLERSELLTKTAPIFREALFYLGHPATRNRGTVGGSICHLDPAAELPLVFATLGAELIIRSETGERRAGFAAFALDALTPDLTEAEMLTGITFEPWPLGHGYAFEEVAQRRATTALVSAAALMQIGVDQTIQRVSLAIGGATAVPMRLTEVEMRLTGQQLSEELLVAVAAEANTIPALDDYFVSASYRRRVAGTLVRRAITKAAARASQ